MSEENENENSTQESTITSLEDALKEVGKLRKENAAKRVKANEVEQEAAKWREHVQTQQTDLERLTGQVSTTKSEADALRAENAKLRVLREYKVPKEFESLLEGLDTFEQMEKVAKVLAAAPSSDGPRVDFFAGQRGAPVGANAEGSTQEVWADWWNSQEKGK